MQVDCGAESAPDDFLEALPLDDPEQVLLQTFLHISRLQ